MKNLKKFVAALLVLTMVLATGSVAFASSAKFTKEDAVGEKTIWVKFTGNLYAYDKPKAGSRTDIIVKKGSEAMLFDVSKDGKWVKLALSLFSGKSDGVTKWFRTDKLKKTSGYSDIGRVVFASGGSNMSTEAIRLDTKIGKYTNKTVKTTSRVNLRKTASLKGKSQGVVKKGEKVKLTGIVGMDSCGVVFFQAKYNGKTGFISEQYLKVNSETARYACYATLWEDEDE